MINEKKKTNQIFEVGMQSTELLIKFHDLKWTYTQNDSTIHKDTFKHKIYCLTSQQW